MIKSLNTGKTFCKESQLLAPVATFARQKGFCMQMEEMPFYEYRIDLYGFSPRKDVTVAFELKMNDWRRALQQAVLYQICSDLVYIAMPERAAQRVDRVALEKYGIGLIAVLNSGSCRCMIKAAEHTEVREFYRGSHISYLKDSR